MAELLPYLKFFREQIIKGGVFSPGNVPHFPVNSASLLFCLPGVCCIVTIKTQAVFSPGQDAELEEIAIGRRLQIYDLSSGIFFDDGDRGNFSKKSL